MRALRVYLTALVVLCGILWGREVRAEVFHAPVGGRAIAFGQGRVLCGAPPAGWTVESGGRALRPPVDRSALGRIVDATLAASPAECVTNRTDVRLVATGKIPVVNRPASVWYVDEGRLEAEGASLDGSIISWPVPAGLEADRCGVTADANAPRLPAGVERCVWSVARNLTTDPSASPIRLWPAGSLVSTDAVVFDAEGRRVAPAAMVLAPKKVQVSALLPITPAVDVSQGFGLLPLLHPEAAAEVECRGAPCRLDNGQLRVQAPPESVSQVEVRFTVAPGITTPKPGPLVSRVSILRCPMEPVSGAVFRGVPSARLIMKVGAACAKDAEALHYFVGARSIDVAQKINVQDVTYVVLAVGSVDAATLPLTAVRPGVDGAVVAASRVDTRLAPTPRSVLEIAGFPGLDFVPFNRDAVAHFPKVEGGELVLLPVDGVYAVERNGGVTRVRGDHNAAGLATLQLSFRATALPKPLSDVDLALFSDPIQRAVKEANEPAPFDLSATTAQPLAELLCNDEHGHTERVMPGVQRRLPFAMRDNCRLVIHRERLGSELGAQKLRVEMEVRQVDSAVRGDAAISERVVLRRGAEPRISWIKGVRAPYDRVVVRLTHEGDETHYLGGESLLKNAPAVQWSIVFGTGRVRIYATSAIPTGLYRFGGTHGSGAMALSFGVISRFTWVNEEGKEGLLGLEAGVMAFGLTGDTSTSGSNLTQVGGVAGIGLAIPLANASQAAQASINLHGWYEQRLTGGGADKGAPGAFIFGPSISIGNVGGTF
ncbi:MAG: hypothetical protein JWP97_1623 [Labilithrix sp.]|nr:hypothetical protein [Labilithrix sp.]